MHSHSDTPTTQGLYHPSREHDGCGVAFIADIKGKASHQIVKDGLYILGNMVHRGAVSADPTTGDGAGILLQIPDDFFREHLPFSLPEKSHYACGNIFLPKDPERASFYQGIMEKEILFCGLKILGWRDVPVNSYFVGKKAGLSEPMVKQVFLSQEDLSDRRFSLALLRARKRIEKFLLKLDADDKSFVYICSLSADSIVYKGMLLADQLEGYYRDLKEENFISSVALVHQRFSTNTFPAWKLAHPYRVIAHNGEFNTIQGNINAMRGRENNMMSADLSVEEMEDLQPIIMPGLSDSGSFDNALEMMLQTGRSLPHCLAMMVPEAWRSREHMDLDKKGFYKYHASFLEPFDGPATITTYHEGQICAILDRNGLRPARYFVTKDERIIFASEMGVLPVPEKDILSKGRVWPGKMILVDLKKGVLFEDQEVKESFINKRPYQEWVNQNLVELLDLPCQGEVEELKHHPLSTYQQAFGYTEEEIRVQMLPMAINGQEGTGSMGNDTPMAVLSKKTKPLFEYFRQRFAQVTNPPIDPIREGLVMGLSSYFGKEWNIFEESAECCKQIRVHSPILTNSELEKVLLCQEEPLRSSRIPILFDATGKEGALEKALEDLFIKVEEQVDKGSHAIILSDREISKEKAAIPVLLALSGVHHYLLRKGKRGNVGIFLETGQARLVHHMAVLIGYGATAVNPYVAFETVKDFWELKKKKADEDNSDIPEYIEWEGNLVKALKKGILKIMSKMGISTVRSYKGAQVFESIGLSQKLVDKYFTGTISLLDGIDLKDVESENLEYHNYAFAIKPHGERHLEWGGDLQWRPDGEYHLFNPETISLLQQSVRQGSYERFKEYSSRINDSSQNHSTFRSLFEFKKSRPSIPLEEVEDVNKIVKRFATGAMSLGSISQEAHENLAIAMNRVGGKSNTGEGGEDPSRFVAVSPLINKRSAIKQIASGRFGVTTHYLVNADELQIKMAQGAKPGEGGQLPGKKVSEYIAKIRNSIPGVTLISPPPHHDIYSIEDLGQLIFDLKNVNPKADITVKLVSEFGVGTVAAGVAKACADTVVISGHDGGTGASPISSIKQAGTPWELGLSETQQTLLLNDLRSRIRIQVDGQMRTGRDIVVAALLGADEFGFATAPLVAQGCIMMRKCHKGTCPVGIATQDPELRKFFPGKPEHVINLMLFMAEEVREIMADLGFATMDDMIGHCDELIVKSDVKLDTVEKIQMDRVLYKVADSQTTLYCSEKQNHDIDDVLDRKLIILAEEALLCGQKVYESLEICSANRTTATMLSGEVAKRFGVQGLPEDTINFQFRGTAGQSFGAFLAPGISLTIDGVANDYLGKGMSGGKIIVRPTADSTLVAHENWIAGNTLLYGATAGEVYLSGWVGERFAVRNSGCHAVVEGAGDHCCEYMTGGIVVVLGGTGRNFAAGMSGGLAYVLDEEALFYRRYNPDMVDVVPLEEEDLQTLEMMITKHYRYTGSEVAKRLLSDKGSLASLFVKVFPKEIQKILKLKNETFALSGV
ncbi:MAG: glutamate synthase (NADPH/NADH) large chain [Chlamydiales bacterium]|jgi:glutamate synthase (NADPH/NADH) large chain